MFQTVGVNPWDILAVETAERFADDLAAYSELVEASAHTTSDWTAAFACREAADPDAGIDSASWAAGNAAHELAERLAGDTVNSPDDPRFVTALQTQRQIQADLLRCIFGNPFRPVAFDPRWRTADVLGVARGVYDERAFGRLPVLMDALLDAGCDNADVLEHCRSEGPHARGCWVVDLVLGKT
jgi:hypothetical protein